MDDLSTLGPLALGLLAWALGLAALMTRRTGLCAPSLGCCAVALSLVPLHVYLEVEAGDLSAIQDTAPQRRRSGSWNPGAQRRGMAPYQI